MPLRKEAREVIDLCCRKTRGGFVSFGFWWDSRDNSCLAMRLWGNPDNLVRAKGYIFASSWCQPIRNGVSSDLLRKLSCLQIPIRICGNCAWACAHDPWLWWTFLMMNICFPVRCWTQDALLYFPCLAHAWHDRRTWCGCLKMTRQTVGVNRWVCCNPQVYNIPRTALVDELCPWPLGLSPEEFLQFDRLAIQNHSTWTPKSRGRQGQREKQSKGRRLWFFFSWFNVCSRNHMVKNRMGIWTNKQHKNQLF